MRHQIVLVHEDSAVPQEGYLDLDDDWEIGTDAKGRGVTVAAIEQVTLERLADMCDQNAEARNHSGFIGAHRILAALLHQQLGREQATRLLWEIASRDGLDGMNGVGGQKDSYGEFGLQEPWHDWQLPA
jgi:hypothetical protein